LLLVGTQTEEEVAERHLHYTVSNHPEVIGFSVKYRRNLQAGNATDLNAKILLKLERWHMFLSVPCLQDCIQLKMLVVQHAGETLTVTVDPTTTQTGRKVSPYMA
jgi:hypothetical protein